jgi:hypothetical protein
MSKSGVFVGPIEVLGNIPRTRCTYTHHIVALNLLRITLMLRFDSKEKAQRSGHVDVTNPICAMLWHEERI